MKIRTLFFLLAMPLCCFGERDFTMVDLRNGLTTELLEVGPILTKSPLALRWHRAWCLCCPLLHAKETKNWKLETGNCIVMGLYRQQIRLCESGR